MGERFRDFDAFEAEQSAEPVVFKLGGREWTARHAGDAATYLRVLRNASRDGAAGLVAMAEYLEAVLAEEERAEFMAMLAEKRVSTKTILEVVGWVFGQATGLPFDGASRSASGRSKTGARSKARSRSKGSKPDSSLSAVS